MKTILLSFNHSQIDPAIVLKIVDESPVVVDWLRFDANTYLVRSPLDDLFELSKIIREHLPTLQFFISEVRPDTCDGWMPQPVWDFVNQVGQLPQPRQAVPMSSTPQASRQPTDSSPLAAFFGGK